MPSLPTSDQFVVPVQLPAVEIAVLHRHICPLYVANAPTTYVSVSANAGQGKPK